MPFSVIICDDHFAIREGLIKILEAAQIPVVGGCSSVSDLLELANQHPTSIVVTDLAVDGMQFPELAKKLREQSNQLKIVVYSARELPVTMGMCYEVGAVAFVPKTAQPAEIIQALRFAARGERYFPATVASMVYALNHDRRHIMSSLSSREMQAFLSYSKNPSVEELASNMGVSEKTVQNVLAEISKKLDAPRSTFNHLAQKFGFLDY